MDVHGPDFRLPEGTELAYNIIHGTFGEDGTLQAILEECGVPYTGAGSRSSALCFNKSESKKFFWKPEFLRRMRKFWTVPMAS